MQANVGVIGTFRFLPEQMTYPLPHLKATIEKFDFKRRLQHLPVMPPQATYLAWVDCSALKLPSARIAEILLDKGKLWINEGILNIACPRDVMAQGLGKMNAAFG